MRLFKTQRKLTDQLVQQILSSELLRVRIFLGIFSFGAAFFFIALILFYDLFKTAFGNAPVQFFPIFFSFISLYFLFLNFRIKQVISGKIKLPRFVRYFSAFVEVSIPTVPLFFLGRYLDSPIYVLETPPVFVYFIFIILSALRLDVKISIFSGLVAGIEFFSLSIYLKNITDVNKLDLFFNNNIIYTAKAAMLIVSGLLVGFVTNEILTRMDKSFEALEERNYITDLFGKHVSPEVVDKLLNQSTDLETEVRHVCMMFFDIRNFTTFSEKRDPVEVINFLNTLFDFIIDIINKHGGIINKFLGDGFMAVFGAPLSSGQDIENAILASKEILEEIDKKAEEGIIPKVNIGIGLHSGNAVTGNVGSKTRKEYTIIGDVVNLASRIEQLNKTYNSKILVSEEVYNGNPGDKGELIGEVEVKGRKEKVKIYKLA